MPLALSSKSKLTWAARAAVLALSLGLVAGCQNGFIDPTEMGRYDQEPLVRPILNNLNTGIEEPSDEFLGATDPKPEDLTASEADYRIGKNDLLSITISDLIGPGVETTKTTRVSESGNISLPLIGQIKAINLTEAELEDAVKRAYADAKLIANAQVSVQVNEARGRAFSILGAVGAPGQYAIINSDFRVLDALVLARDVQQVGVDYMYIIRKVDQGAPANNNNPPRPNGPRNTTTAPGGDVFEPRSQGASVDQPAMLQTAREERVTTIAGQPATRPFGGFNQPGPAADKRVIRVPLVPLRSGDLRYNVVIRPQDMIIVPQPTIGEYYMGGHVARVGVYSLTGRKITLKQAIVSAGMLDPIAIPSRTDIIRRVGADQEVWCRVDLSAIFAGDQSDIYLKPNDIVQVGTTAWAPFVAAVRGAFRFTYGFGFIYDRNFYDGNND